MTGDAAESMGDVGRLEHELSGRRRILCPNLHLPDALTPFRRAVGAIA